MSNMFDNQKFPTENQEFFGWIVDYMEDEGRILYKVRVPNLWGPNVSDESLVYCPAEYSPTLGSGMTSGGALDKGQFVRIKIDHGQGPSGQFTIRSIYHSTLRSNSEMPGNFSWNKMYGDLLAEMERIGVRLPPDIQKKINSKGVEVAEALEKGAFHLRDLIGIATHGSQSPLNGVLIPQIKGIQTAIDAAENSLSASGLLDQLPGIPFKFSDIFDILGKENTKILMDSLPEKVSDALQSVVALVQNYSSEISSISNIRINPEIFASNILKLLEGTESISLLLERIKVLMTDKSLYGLDNLQKTIGTVTNMFGDVLVEISGNGSSNIISSSDATSALNSFSSMMGTFKNASGTVFDTVEDIAALLKRLETDVGKTIKENLEKTKNTENHIDMVNYIG